MATDASIRPREFERRRPAATGVPVRLSDGHDWLLRSPRFRLDRCALTDPNIDDVVCRIYDSLVLDRAVSLADAWELARILLLSNYELDQLELEELLCVAEGPQAQSFVQSIVDAVLGDQFRSRTYTDWIRASLLANSLSSQEFGQDELSLVLSILVATNRTIPPQEFIDSHVQAKELADLEGLV